MSRVTLPVTSVADPGAPALAGRVRVDRQRVVGVRGPAGPGSGYVIAARLVLTAAHVVGELGSEVGVLRLAEETRYAATVVWRGTPGGRDDAALVVVHDGRWRAPVGAAVRWGRTVTYRTGIACAAWGFPDLVQRAGRAAETLQPSGTLNPGDRYVGDRYVMGLDQHPPEPGAQGRSPWGGLSGAALFCGNLLAGVIVVDPKDRAHAHLEAVPAYVLHHDPTFRAVLANHIEQRDETVALEPIEWPELSDPGARATGGQVRSPAGLLSAQRAVVPFHGRTRLLGELRAWAATPGFSAWLIHGPGGQGKTRLAHYLAAELAGQRWEVLWLDPRAEYERLPVLADAAVPLLVVVDYAETRPDQLAELLRVCARAPGGTPVKVLLLARTAGPWWDKLTAEDPVTEALLEGAPVTALPALEPDPDGRKRAYQAAVAAFAAQLPQVAGQHDQPWAKLAADMPTPALDQPGFQAALTLHMTALADLLDTAHPTPTHAPNGTEMDTAVDTGEGAGVEVEDRLLVHERRYWRRTATAKDLHPALSMECLTDTLAAAVLLGAADRAQADALLCRVPRMEGQSRDRREGVRDWIAALYPPSSGTPWGALQPDRLAERFAGRHLYQHNPDLAAALLPDATSPQLTQLLTVYARAAAHPVFQHALDDTLTQLCTDHAGVLAAPALW